MVPEATPSGATPRRSGTTHHGGVAPSTNPGVAPSTNSGVAPSNPDETPFIVIPKPGETMEAAAMRTVEETLAAMARDGQVDVTYDDNGTPLYRLAGGGDDKPPPRFAQPPNRDSK